MSFDKIDALEYLVLWFTPLQPARIDLDKHMWAWKKKQVHGGYTPYASVRNERLRQL